MSLGNTFENEIMGLIFNAAAIANLADNASVSPLTNLHIALHTASPGEAGTQATNECAYGAYARVAVARTSGGWTITANEVTPVANVDFPEATSGTETATHFSVGVGASGTTKILMYGTITPNIAISTGVVPRLKAGTTVLSVD